MQYLMIDGNETLTSMSRTFGQANVSDILAENGIPRTPNVGQEWDKKCQSILDSTTKDVTPERKMALLNGLTGSEDIFEKACLMDEDEWKVFSATGAFMDALKVPESVDLPYSTKVMGSTPTSPVSTSSNVGKSALNITSSSSKDYRVGSNVVGTVVSSNRDVNSAVKYSTGDSSRTLNASSNPVSSVTYRAVMNSLKTEGSIDASIFNSVNTGPNVSVGSGVVEAKTTAWAFNLPWGKIQMYSTILGELIDFPVYPEQVQTARQATYASMPDIIYQYEPWITFQNSGPREQNLDFHIHRDMWTGDHRDGKANRLIRFCEANTFPDYNGSAVSTPLIRLYVDGTLFISGVLKNVSVTWSGPLGLDNWYLEFTLSLAIQEVSESELNCKSFYKRSLKEG